MLPGFVTIRWLRIILIIVKMALPILDFSMDYFNSFRAINGANLSLAARSIQWAMLLNVFVTPMLAATGNRSKKIENKLAKVMGRRLAVYFYILFALVIVIFEELEIAADEYELTKRIMELKGVTSKK